MAQRHVVQVVSQWDRNRTDWLLGSTLRAPGQSCDYNVESIPVHRFGLSMIEKIRLAPYLPIYYPLMELALSGITPILNTHLEPYAARADLIHNVRIGREGISYASFQSARRHNIPFVLTPVHHPRWVGWRYRAYNKLYKMADALFALTNAEKQILVGLGVHDEHVTVTGIGPILAEQADPQGFRAKYKIDGPMILFVGQHYAYKGYRQLLQATHAVWQKVPEANFVFIGPSVKDSEQDFAQYADPRIHRLGQVDLQVKTDAFAACTVFCMPSSQESFGGVYTEAWHFARPVIGCNIPAVAEVIEDGVNGYLVNQEPAEIADRIISLLLNPTLAERMGAAGQHKLNKRFTWQQIAQRVEQAYLATL